MQKLIANSEKPPRVERINPSTITVPGAPKGGEGGKPTSSAAFTPSMPTNAEFIAAIFTQFPEGTQPLITAKSGDPQEGGWFARPAAEVASICLAGRNTYVNCATFKPGDDGTVVARKDHAAAYHALVLDDVGTKVDRSLLGSITPTWELETSPGNFQIGFKLNPPLSDAAEVDRFQQRIAEAGLTDKGAMGMARWVRLPVGINGKPQYAVDGQVFICRLHDWHPEKTFSADELLATLAPQAISENQAIKETPTFVPAKMISHEPTALPVLVKLLDAIAPDCPYPDWLSVLMGIFYETGGSDAGLELADSWSSKGKSYKSRAEIEAKWRSFRGNVANPVTVATLVARARDAGANIGSILHGDFQRCETVVIHAPEAPVAQKPATKASPLMKYSLIGQAAKYEALAQAATPILGDLCLRGEATVWYAKHNTGKTLLFLHMASEAVAQKRLAAANMFFINADDSSAGIAVKLGLTDEIGAHMLVPGQGGFKAQNLEELLLQAVRNDTARGSLVVIDTLKKFVDLMNKRQASDFANNCRQFVAAGGTLLGLAHVNKRRSDDGKAIHAGTTDILDDFDAGYIIDELPLSGHPGQKFVEFTRLKGRGGGVHSVAYTYAAEDNVSYAERLASVRLVDQDDLDGIKRVEAERSDAELIDAVASCITGGTNTKIALRDAVAASAKISRRAAQKIIERYDGDDPSCHRWSTSRKAHGAFCYRLLDAAGDGVT